MDYSNSKVSNGKNVILGEKIKKECGIELNEQKEEYG